MRSLFPDFDNVSRAIERIKTFAPPEGYYLAFSGGKDSIVLYHLTQRAGVKFDAHYNVTGVDPPELVKFIRTNYPDVKFEFPEITMWKLIPQKLFPPTRGGSNKGGRYCCEYLKERGGKGRSVLLGIRSQESNTRSKYQLVEHCSRERKLKVMPIIDWLVGEVWKYIYDNKIPYCELYDQGFNRLGCISCPMAGGKMMKWELNRYPKYKQMYLRAFQRMLDERKRRGKKTTWTTPEEVMKWWTSSK